MSTAQVPPNAGGTGGNESTEDEITIRTRLFYPLFGIAVIVGVILDVFILILLNTYVPGRARTPFWIFIIPIAVLVFLVSFVDDVLAKHFPNLVPEELRRRRGGEGRWGTPAAGIPPGAWEPDAGTGGPAVPAPPGYGPCAAERRSAPVRATGCPADGTAEHRLRPHAQSAGSSRRSAAGPVRSASAAGPGAAIGPGRPIPAAAVRAGPYRPGSSESAVLRSQRAAVADRFGRLLRPRRRPADA